MPIGQSQWDPDATHAEQMVIPVGARDQAPAAPSALERLVGSQPYWDSRTTSIPAVFTGWEIRWRAPVQRIVVASVWPLALSFDRGLAADVAGGFDALHLGLGQSTIACPPHTTLRILGLGMASDPDHYVTHSLSGLVHVIGHGGAHALVPDVGYHAFPADWDDGTNGST